MSDLTSDGLTADTVEALAREWVRENRAKALTEALTVVCLEVATQARPKRTTAIFAMGLGRDLAIGVRRLREYDDEFGEPIESYIIPAEWLEAVRTHP